MKKYPKLAVLLAAGFGRRLLPYTKQTPKSLLTTEGKPLLTYFFSAIKNTGIKKVVIVTNHLEEQIISFATDTFSHLVDIEFRHQPDLNGSAGALRCAVDLIQRSMVDSFLVSAADYQMPPNYLKEFIRFHVNGDQDLSIGMRSISSGRVKESNLTVIDQDNRVTSLSEKPSRVLKNGKYRAAYLLYIVPVQILDYLNRISMSERGEYELPDLVNIMIMENYEVRGYLGEKFIEWEKQYASK